MILLSYPNVLHIWNTNNIQSELTYFMGDGHQVIMRRMFDHYRMVEICKNVIETDFPFGPNKLDIMWFYLRMCKVASAWTYYMFIMIML